MPKFTVDKSDKNPLKQNEILITQLYVYLSIHLSYCLLFLQSIVFNSSNMFPFRIRYIILYCIILYYLSRYGKLFVIHIHREKKEIVLYQFTREVVIRRLVIPSPLSSIFSSQSIYLYLLFILSFVFRYWICSLLELLPFKYSITLS